MGKLYTSTLLRAEMLPPDSETELTMQRITITEARSLVAEARACGALRASAAKTMYGPVTADLGLLPGELEQRYIEAEEGDAILLGLWRNKDHEKLLWALVTVGASGARLQEPRLVDVIA